MRGTYLFLLIATALLTVGGHACGALPPLQVVDASSSGTVENLGQPVLAWTIWGRMLATRPDGGRALVCGTWVGSGTARLIVYYPDQSRIRYILCPGTHGSYGLAQGLDGTIYIGCTEGGKLLRWDWESDRAELIGSPCPGTRWLYNLTVAEDGKLYGGTYPGARVGMYDPATGRMRDYGPMRPPSEYVSGICTGPGGKIFCGIGNGASTAGAAVIVLDPRTGRKHDILPKKYVNNSFAKVYRVGDYIACFLQFDNRTVIFDGVTEELIQDFGPNSGIMPAGSIAYVAFGGFTYRYHPPSGHLVKVPPLPSGTGGVAPDRMVYGITESDCFWYDWPHAKYLDRTPLQPGSEGQNIFTLHTGPDGNVYGSSYNLHHIFRYNPTTGELIDLGNPCPGRSGEVYSFYNQGTKIWMASYTNAVLSVYDTARPWQPGKSPDSNPRDLGSIGNEQYRTPGLCVGPDGKVYIGSMPAYGKKYGALTVYNPRTEQVELCLRPILGGENVYDLLPDSRRRVIYGGSDSHFFIFDVDKQQVVFSAPIGGRPTGITQAGNDLVFFGAGTRLVIFDPQTRKFLCNDTFPLGTINALEKGDDGRLYGDSGRLFVLDPKTMVVQDLGPGGAHLARDRQGALYFARGPYLYRWRPTKH